MLRELENSLSTRRIFDSLDPIVMTDIGKKNAIRSIIKQVHRDVCYYVFITIIIILFDNVILEIHE